MSYEVLYRFHCDGCGKSEDAPQSLGAPNPILPKGWVAVRGPIRDRLHGCSRSCARDALMWDFDDGPQETRTAA